MGKVELRTLYQNTSRAAAWRRLVEGVVPSLIDPINDGPLPGREESWSLATEYRVEIALSDRLFSEAERLQRQAIDWNRKRAEPALASSVEPLDDGQRHRIRSLAIGIERLGSIQLGQENADCVRQFEDARDFYKMIADRQGQAEAVLVFNIGKAYLILPSIRSLDRAADLFEESRELHAEIDHHGRAHCWGALGRVAGERFLEARMAKQSTDHLLKHINAAASSYHKALDLLPETASSDRGITHNQLGNIYGNAGDIDLSLSHHQQAIRYAEAEGDIFGAGQIRVNVAITLAKTVRLPDARAYAEAAISNFATFGDRAAAAEMQHAQELLDTINQAIADQENPS